MNNQKKYEEFINQNSGGGAYVAALVTIVILVGIYLRMGDIFLMAVIPLSVFVFAYSFVVIYVLNTIFKSKMNSGDRFINFQIIIYTIFFTGVFLFIFKRDTGFIWKHLEIIMVPLVLLGFLYFYISEKYLIKSKIFLFVWVLSISTIIFIGNNNIMNMFLEKSMLDLEKDLEKQKVFKSNNIENDEDFPILIKEMEKQITIEELE